MNSLNEIPLSEKQSIMEMYNKPVEVKEEGFVDDLKHLRIKNIGKGIKGIMGNRGGYYYFSTLQSIRKLINKIQKTNRANDAYIAKLDDLKKYAATANMPDEKRKVINAQVFMISSKYKEFQNALSRVEAEIIKGLD
jgi:ribosomal protein S6